MIKLGSRFTLLILFAITLLTTGCHHGTDPGNTFAPASVTTSILSDPVADGEIYVTPPPSSSLTIIQGMSSTIQDLYAGVDLGTNSGVNHRAFLDFPLDGSTNFSVIPSDAIIDSATLEFYVNSVYSASPTATVPIFIDLVAYDPIGGLVASDYDNQYIDYISINPPIATSEAGSMITVDVTALMDTAQAQGLSDFQVRILEDTGAAYNGIINIDDRTSSDRASFAPQLTVTYH